MRILFVADVSVQDVIGGAERVLAEQAIRLADLGHDVHVLTRLLLSHTSDYFQVHGVHEWRYNINESNALSYIWSTIKNARKVYRKLIASGPFDVINFHQPFTAFAINLVKESKKSKKIYTCHSLSFEEYLTREKNPGKLNACIRRSIEKYSMNHSKHVIVLSQFTKDKLTEIHGLPESKISIIPGAADIVRFHPCKNKKGLREELGINKDQFILFTVRNLVPRMGLNNLISALGILKDQIPDLYLYLGGKGPLMETLQKQVRDLGLKNHIHFSGFLSKEDLPKYFQMADYFILPTVDLEGFGLVTIEALACGTPVLGTPVGGTREILSKFDVSFLFENTTPEAIARLILEKYRYYVNCPVEYNLLRVKCRAFIEEFYSWEINVKRMEKLFKG